VESLGHFLGWLGWAVRPGEPFEKSHVGNPFSTELSKDELMYAPSQAIHTTLEYHRLNVCDALVREEVDLPRVTWHDPAIAAQIYVMIIFAIFITTRAILAYFDKQGMDERKLRNTAIYIVQLGYSIVALPVILIALGQSLSPSTSFIAVDRRGN